ncbi:UDP-N-acetylmuramoyl-tripeptide--D-alanyl-D-alanine ligase [Pseudonocardia acaciae]|uniref:UDP-N-acetylmuramoyl-tripeptide--D-alanyl-D- alanine ligase n=1 Tax=Pseudonocardia acaciae TaxID=551276 RepID=UPI00048A77A2|nr:UDP-N-acetylmuramoyl-tripeptide--D-alanyl-D-alanine ligase [Pseudonocardia acaciae]
MITMTLAEVAAAVDGRTHRAAGTEPVTGSVEFDSRKVTPGGLFVALPGERVDGHDYAAAAHAAGAAAVLAARAVDAPAVLVGAPGEDPERAVLGALSRLAAHVVRRLPGLEVVGLTGSSGKTSTKDLVAAVLRRLGPTVAPPGSFNNEIGHPWTVLRADEHARHLVLELAARRVGHIAALCTVAPPRVGAVLNVGSAHLGEFGSPEAVATAKGELVEALPAAPDGGVAVLNADDPRVAAMAARTEARVVTFGSSGDLRAVKVTLDEAGRPRFRLVTPAGEAELGLRLVGAHHVGNALAAAAVGLELGAGLDLVADVLATAEPASRWRMEVIDRPDGVTVINDAYNANLESMRAGLEALAAVAGGRRRCWAVLGTMAELGEITPAAHEEIGGLAARLGVRCLVAVGTGGDAESYRAGYRAGDGEESIVVPDVAAAMEVLQERLRPGDVVLVKASRSAGLERIAAGLLEPPVAAGPTRERS